MVICRYCSRNFSNNGGLVRHEKHCKSNPDRVQAKISPNAGAKKGNVPWNKGKTTSESHRKSISESLKGRKHSKETKKKLSKIAKERGLGGITEGGGRGMKGRYKGFWCDSSWELAYLIYCLDKNIDINRNTERFPYEYMGENQYYIPDFIVEGEYVEIKGYVTEKWKAKQKYFPHKLRVLYKKDLKKYIDYAVDKYGKDFTKLYEDRDS